MISRCLSATGEAIGNRFAVLVLGVLEKPVNQQSELVSRTGEAPLSRRGYDRVNSLWCFRSLQEGRLADDALDVHGLGILNQTRIHS